MGYEKHCQKKPCTVLRTTIVASAKLVSARYGHPARSLKVIAVTGTNGKTTTVNYLNEILKEAGKTTAMFSTATIEIAGKTRRNNLNATVASVRHMQEFFRDAKRARVDYVVMEFTTMRSTSINLLACRSRCQS